MAKRRDPEKVVREIKRKTRRKFSSEEKIRIVLDGSARTKRPSLNSGAVRASAPTSTTTGPRSSLRPASSACRATPSVRRTTAPRLHGPAPGELPAEGDGGRPMALRITSWLKKNGRGWIGQGSGPGMRYTQGREAGDHPAGRRSRICRSRRTLSRLRRQPCFVLSSGTGRYRR